jgi:hypothetical protein
MPESISLIKANPLIPAEDYVALRKQGFKYIEQTGSDIWTDYNNSDPGITILEAVCYAITDLAYRTGFEIKDLLAPEQLTSDTWKQIFYTAKQILHNSPLTINDYRKLIIDVKGVRNAWIEKSKDYEVPVWIDYNYPSEGKYTDCSCAGATGKICYGKLGLDAITTSTYKDNFRKDELDKLEAALANAEGDEKTKIQDQIDEINKLKDQIPDDINSLIASKIVEFEGLYQVMIEYEESVVDENEKNEVRDMVVEKLAANRNLCEDVISVDAVEYENFGIGLFASLEEYADPDIVLAQVFFTIYKYFTPSVPYYTIQQMMDKGYQVDEIFEGPALKHGFIDDAALEKTDLFRDIRLSDIISELADIKGVKAISYLHLPFTGVNETASLKEFFNLWIKQLKDERKVARIQPSMSQITFCKERETITYYMGRKEDRRPDRMLKLFKDLKTLESKYKLIGAQDDFPVPAGKYMNLEDYFPVTYSLPMCYGVGEKDNLPANADEKRKVQALQLKGYMLFFEQILADYLVRLNHLRDLFSFDDSIHHTAFIRALYSATDYTDTQLSEIRDLKTLLIDRENRGADHWDEILKDFSAVLKNLVETPKQFNKRRNIFLNHMLARFSEDLSEYEAISQWLTPYKLQERLIADKIRMLKNGEYYKISTQRGKAYDYTKYNTWNSANVSGAERRVGRLLGFADITCRKLATDYVIVEPVTDAANNKTGKNIIKLLDPDNKEIVLLTSVEVGDGCCTELLINAILKYADERIYFKFLNGTKQRRRNYEESMEPFWFELYDSADEEVAVLLATSEEFNTQKDRENAFDKLQKLLDAINGNEGMHLVEHLLLRPKLDEVLDEESAVESVSFLNLCLDKCDLGIGLNEGTEPPVYKKLITRISAEKCYDGMPWVLEYCKLPATPDSDCNSVLFQQAFPDKSEPVKLKFRTYKLLTQRVRDLQEYGSEKINYEIVSNLEEQDDPADTQYSFIIHGEKNVVLAQSDFIFCKRTQKQIEDGLPCTGPGDDIDDAIDVLIRYFGFELDFFCDEDPCDNNEDPYSFRVTVVLPCWPKRLRDATFRNFVEKTIQTEFPAHIHPRIAWVGLQEMQRFEEVYINWLEEMAQNEMPRYEIVNPLVDKLNTLQPCTCDDDCSS